ncbi:RNA polymerase sigma-70 factor [Olivibacter ginsenosidimutans]|uniref:RNA polymerase sigma-70 factor n=1 Tax=Olivibacter ginsenosidimutans TaxID=1176537 RepID=A0ABP9BNZ6_9SPHI
MSAFTYRFPHDRDKWESIYKNYYQLLCHFAYGYLGNHALSEDIVQGILVKLWQEKVQFDDEAHLKHYLYKSVKNRCLNEVNTSIIRDKITQKLSAAAESEENDLFHHIVRTELYGRILQAIDALPNKTAAVFKLAYLEQKSNPEIAELLSLSINTVKVHKNNAKKQLRTALKDLYPLLFLLLHKLQ